MIKTIFFYFQVAVYECETNVFNTCIDSVKKDELKKYAGNAKQAEWMRNQKKTGCTPHT